MQSTTLNVFRRHTALVRGPSRFQHRCASLTGAIERGIRKSRSDVRPTWRKSSMQFVERIEPRGKQGENRQSLRSSRNDNSLKQPRKSSVQFVEQTSPQQEQGRSRNSIRNSRNNEPLKETRKSPERRRYDEHPPQSIQYTTAASEFLYGTFAVDAALRSNRRQLYRLYIYHAEDQETEDIPNKAVLLGIEKRAMIVGVDVKKVRGSDWKKMLNRMADNRPHNGVVLEASRIPQLPVVAMQKHDEPGSAIQTSLMQQVEDEQIVNHTSKFPILSGQMTGQRAPDRYPFLLFLDRITDSGNMGAILRTANYFGVDGIIVTEHGSAPLSPLTIKASGGAAEHIPILCVKDEDRFIKQSQENGWRFFAAVAPESSSGKFHSQQKPLDLISVSQAQLQSPCILMLGNEAEGIRPRLAKLADDVVAIYGAPERPKGIDSLNVSVAAALLMHDFLRPLPSLGVPNNQRSELW